MYVRQNLACCRRRRCVNPGRCEAADALSAIDGVELINDSFFNEFTLRLPRDASDVVEELAAKGVIAGVPGGRLWPEDEDKANLLVVAATETVTQEHIKAYADALKEVL